MMGSEIGQVSHADQVGHINQRPLLHSCMKIGASLPACIVLPDDFPLHHSLHLESILVTHHHVHASPMVQDHQDHPCSCHQSIINMQPSGIAFPVCQAK